MLYNYVIYRLPAPRKPVPPAGPVLMTDYSTGDSLITR